MSTLLNSDRAVYIAAQTAADDITTPDFDKLFGNGAPVETIEYTASSIVDPDGQAPEQVVNGTSISATIETEFTDQMIPILQKAVHGLDQVVNDTSTTVSFTGSMINAGAANPFAQLYEGDFFFVTGSNSNDGWHRIETRTASNEVVVSNPLTNESAGASVTIYVRKVASAKNRFYDIMQERVKDTSKVGDIAYKTYYNGTIDTLSISIGDEGIVTASAGYLFEKAVPGFNSLPGQTDTIVSNGGSYSSVSNVTGYYVDGVNETCVIKSMNIEINNNYETDKASACKAQILGRSAIEATASITARTSTSNPFKWRSLSESSTDAAFAVALKNKSGDKETLISLDKCKITESQFVEDETFATSEFTAVAQRSDKQNTTITIYTNF